MNYKDDDGGKGMQERRANGPDEFTLKAQPGNYQELYVWVASGAGPTQLVFTLTYARRHHRHTQHRSAGLLQRGGGGR